MRAALEAIRDYEPSEIVKDDFAYDRMVEAYRDAAKNGLATLAATQPGGEVSSLGPKALSAGARRLIANDFQREPVQPAKEEGE